MTDSHPVQTAQPATLGAAEDELTRPSPILITLTAALIYSMFVPFVLRSDYMLFDRARLPYLSLLERFNCAYCSYANGVIAYVREVAARTEQYWCAIKHAQPPRVPHARYDAFAEYGDARGYQKKRDSLREALNPPAPGR
ncbi:MAG TPA: hypothetical protein VJT80_04415 [Steroidobacteraceae bacterium]|nr:hypothetical protein [Steroidobacteraceae bacterium]